MLSKLSKAKAALEKDVPSILKRGLAFCIDTTFTTLIRVFASLILWLIWFRFEQAQFLQSFKQSFGDLSSFSVETQEHVDFVVRYGIVTKVILYSILITLSGGIYYIIMHCSTWQATVGKRAMGFYVQKRNFSKIDSSIAKNLNIDFSTSFWRYFAGLIPWILPFLLYYLYQSKHYFTLLAFAAVWAFWYEVSLFNKSKRSIHDIMCGTTLVLGKKNVKFGFK